MGMISDLWVKLGLRKDGFDKGLDDAKKKTNVFGNAVKKIGGLLAGAFAVDRLIAFGRELVQIGGVAQGVEDAFARIGDAQTLRGLQQATRGTVSELELMKRAVSANNLGIPIQNLASLFEFATKRAQDTGESVDYLVQSITTGIGRKSPLILDNLGISAIQLREKLNGVGLETASVADVAAAVGDIAAESMSQSGDIIETNAIKVQNLTAMWDNFKKSIATSKAVINSVGDSLTKFQQVLFVWSSDNATALEKWAISFELFDKRAERLYNQVKKRDDEQKKREEQAAERRRMQTELFDMFGKSVNDATQAELDAAEKSAKAQWELIKAETERGRLLSEIKEETEALKASLESYGVNQKEEIQNTLRQIDANEKLIESLTTLKRTKDAAIPDTMDSRGTSQDELAGLFPDLAVDSSTLDNLDAFKAAINERYATLIDDETLAKMKERFDMTEDFIDSFNAAFVSGVSDMLTQVSTALGEAIAGGGWDNFGKAVLQAIGGFLQQMGGLLIAYGTYLALADAGIKAGPPGWPLVLAAGIGLVAAGSAISALSSKGLGGGAYSGATASTGGSSASTALSGDVRFVLEGDKLVGAINGSRQRRSITG